MRLEQTGAGRDRALWQVIKGEAEASQRGPDGSQVVINRFGPGDYFGESGLLNDAPRTATVRALTDVTAMSLDRETFGSLMTQSEISRGELERVVRQRLAQSS